MVEVRSREPLRLPFSVLRVPPWCHGRLPQAGFCVREQLSLKVLLGERSLWYFPYWVRTCWRQAHARIDRSSSGYKQIIR
jgi:hypothetical protein